ncbi:hypothetical protein DM826_07365 [Halonotius aquaticus]|uniref:Uncharacterized protein n=1 Tax=Halonotius aquaticus TaxID=2216978 RepID=A0A3A6PNI6_9EURY|nr:hypothetical protein [Halonotius aquaticus]RJX43117.1 hypothetical protein DM826_07365 [Halonotius aquaticus]
MTEGGEGGLYKALTGAFDGFLETVVSALDTVLGPIINWAVGIMTGTPYPSPASGGIFGAPPTDSSFYSLYNIYHDAILPISTLLVMLGLAVFLFTGIWSAKKERVTAIRRLMFAIPAILMWWYIAGWYLQFVQAFTDLLMQIGMQQSATDNLLINDPGDIAGGVVVVLVLYVVGILPIAAVLAIYLIRWISIHLYMAGMPLLIAIWCIPVGPFSNWAESLIKKFVPITLIPIPVAFLLSMFAVIDVSTVAFSGVPGAGEIFDMIIGLIVLAIAAYLPKSMLSMNLGSSLSTAARGARYAAAGAATGSTPGGATTSAAGGGGGSSTAAQSGLGEFGGGSSDAGDADSGSGESLQESTHSNTFAHPKASKSRRRRERAAKVGVGGRKAGAKLHGAAAKTVSASGSATETAAGTAYKNYTKDGSTAKGIASDAKQGAKRRGKQLGKKAAGAAKSPVKGMSKRMQRARDNMARRSQEFTEKWGHDSATQWSNASGELAEADLPALPPAETELGEMASGATGSLWEDESGDGGLWSDLDGGGGVDEPAPGESDASAGMFIEDYSSTDQISRDTTYDRNSTGREVGSFGSD